MSTTSKPDAAFQSLSLILGPIPPPSSSSPAFFLLHDPHVSLQISSHLKQPNSGAGDNDLCRWLYDTFQSSDPTLQLVVLKFLPIIGGVYLSRASLRKSLAGFEAILLAIYAHETTTRKGQPMTVSVPDLSHPSVYHEAAITNSCTELNMAFLSQSLEPFGTIRSTKRARIVGVALELYYSKIALMPVSSKLELCEFCVVWAGQDERVAKQGNADTNIVKIASTDQENSNVERNETNAGEKSEEGEGNVERNESNAEGEVDQENTEKTDNADKDMSERDEGGASTSSNKTSEEKEGRIHLPWELLQPVLRILSHCLLGPTKSKEIQEAAYAASRSLYARALHDVDPRAILATGSLVRLGKMALDPAPVPADPTEICDFNNPVLTI